LTKQQDIFKEENFAKTKTYAEAVKVKSSITNSNIKKTNFVLSIILKEENITL
jgi:hypothetical protein